MTCIGCCMCILRRMWRWLECCLEWDQMWPCCYVTVVCIGLCYHMRWGETASPQSSSMRCWCVTNKELLESKYCVKWGVFDQLSSVVCTIFHLYQEHDFTYSLNHTPCVACLSIYYFIDRKYKSGFLKAPVEPSTRLSKLQNFVHILTSPTP